MVEAIGSCGAAKMPLPLTREPVMVVGQVMEPLPHLIDTLVERFLTPLVQAALLRRGPG